MAADTARIASTAARRLQAGDLSRQDTLRLEIEAQRARGDELTTLIELKRANIALAQLIGHTSADFLHAEFAVPKISVFANNTALLMQIDQRADVRAAQQRVAAARAALDNASAQKYSDITWGASADHYPGTSKRLFELRMQMPLQVGYQYQGEIVRAQAQLTTASDSLEKIRRTATMDILKLDADAQSANLRQQTYAQEIVPRAQMVAQQAELAYSKGASSLSDLLDTRRTLRATQIEALTARSDYAKAIVAWQLRMQPHSVLEQL
jgi:cobalt-zinc-cadmium efflux system outer membrane protein